MGSHPDALPGIVFAASSTVALVSLCVLFLPINHTDFWRGAVITWPLVLAGIAIGFVAGMVWWKLTHP